MDTGIQEDRRLFSNYPRPYRLGKRISASLAKFRLLPNPPSRWTTASLRALTRTLDSGQWYVTRAAVVLIQPRMLCLPRPHMFLNQIFVSFQLQQGPSALILCIPPYRQSLLTFKYPRLQISFTPNKLTEQHPNRLAKMSNAESRVKKRNQQACTSCRQVKVSAGSPLLYRSSQLPHRCGAIAGRLFPKLTLDVRKQLGMSNIFHIRTSSYETVSTLLLLYHTINLTAKHYSRFNEMTSQLNAIQETLGIRVGTSGAGFDSASFTTSTSARGAFLSLRPISSDSPEHSHQDLLASQTSHLSTEFSLATTPKTISFP